MLDWPYTFILVMLVVVNVLSSIGFVIALMNLPSLLRRSDARADKCGDATDSPADTPPDDGLDYAVVTIVLMDGGTDFSGWVRELEVRYVAPGAPR